MKYKTLKIELSYTILEQMINLFRSKAINLRKSGLSYSEILKIIPVAKSTLSLWLHSVGLSKKQKQRLTSKKLAAIHRGSQTVKLNRIDKTLQIKNKASSEIGTLSQRELWLIGISLYWAEGSKEKNYKPGQGVIFSNSDPFMIKVFLKWLSECVEISKKNIIIEIYIHETHRGKTEEAKKYWSSITGFSIKKFDRIYFKKNKIKSIRRNKNNNYHGLLRIRVSRSTDLNRKISGWIEGICYQCGVV